MSSGRQEERRTSDNIVEILVIVTESDVNGNIYDLFDSVSWSLHSDPRALVEREVERRFSPEVEGRTRVSRLDFRLNPRHQRICIVPHVFRELELPQHCAPIERPLEVAEALEVCTHKQQLRVRRPIVFPSSDPFQTIR